MAENSKIEWCRHTWNPWLGCTEVSPACDHCYAKAMIDDRFGRARWGAGEDRVRTSEANRKLPYRWNKAAAAAGERYTVFCLSLGDILDNEVDPLWRDPSADHDVGDARPDLPAAVKAHRQRSEDGRWPDARLRATMSAPIRKQSRSLRQIRSPDSRSVSLFHTRQMAPASIWAHSTARYIPSVPRCAGRSPAWALSRR